MKFPAENIRRQERERCAKVADWNVTFYRELADKAKAAGDEYHFSTCLARAFVSEDIARDIRKGVTPTDKPKPSPTGEPSRRGRGR